ncbi:MAG: metallophosphoesterase family protein [Dehalococcoidales bacterium]|nr:metallophosphoesterase family protein [Dehalococcoidales bacterium]
MLIGLISDTHIGTPEQKIPFSQIQAAFRGVNLILHAGDIWIPRVLDELEAIAPVLCARGDDDMEEDIGADRRVMEKQILNIEGVNIWVTHIRPRYGAINPAHQTPSYASLFPRHQTTEVVKPPDVVVFGHSHKVEMEDFKGTLLVNPGSATMPHYLPKPGTVGLLNIINGKADAQIVQLE